MIKLLGVAVVCAVLLLVGWVSGSIPFLWPFA
jgi:hypothetical protein